MWGRIAHNNAALVLFVFFAALTWKDVHGETGSSSKNEKGESPVLFVAIDSLSPEYLSLNSEGEEGGKDGDWLMPNVRAFLDEATYFADARAYLPSATDMNHLNAIAGTSSAHTGILGVSLQPFGWKPDGTMKMDKPHMTWARDGKGQHVDTLFKAWKRKFPQSKTCYVSGKGWVAEMYDYAESGIDGIVTGTTHPKYIDGPKQYNFYDPPGDKDAATDPESIVQKALVDLFIMADYHHFPPDKWVVDASLDILAEEQPDLALIILAQMDDVQHVLGVASNPAEFKGRRQKSQRSLFARGDRSRRNRMVCREPILDAIRDVDKHFGRLIRGIRKNDYYKDVTIVFYSDHGHITHIFPRELRIWDRLEAVRTLVAENNSREAKKLLLSRGLMSQPTHVVKILHDEGAISDEERDGKGFGVVTATSYGLLYWKADSLEERERRALAAKKILMQHKALNPETNRWECPWDILTQEEMKTGLPEAGVVPGELWHAFYGPNNDDSQYMVWPDVVILMKNGWQLPLIGDVLANLGMDLPFPIPEIPIVLGGHGAADSQRIVMAINGPNIAKGKVIKDPNYEKNYRIADLPMTIAEIFGLGFQTTTVGRSRAADLR